MDITIHFNHYSSNFGFRYNIRFRSIEMVMVSGLRKCNLKEHSRCEITIDSPQLILAV